MKRLLISAAVAALAVPAVIVLAVPAVTVLAVPAIAQDSATPEPAADPAVVVPEAAGDAAADGSTTAAAPVMAPTEVQPVLDSTTPSMLGSWVEGLQVYTTNQPSNSEWSMLEGDAIPAEWDSIAEIDDIVIDETGGQYVIAGYVIDIGGFLGIGAKEVLISTEAMKMATFGGDVVFATNYTRDELAALPDFDDSGMYPKTLTPAAPADPAATPEAAPDAAPDAAPADH